MKQIVFMLLLSVALVLGVVLVQQNQEMRKGAYFARTAMLLKPSDLTKKIGEILPVEIWVVSEGEAKVDGVEAYICFSDKLTPSDSSDIKKSIVPNQDKEFNIVTKAVLAGNNCILFQVGSMGTDTDKLPSGAFKAATFNLKALTLGTGTVSIDQDKTKISGRNTNTASTDTALQITSVEGMNFNITEGGGTEPGVPTTPPSADDMWINYKVSFVGVKANRPCSVNWQTKLTVLSGEVKKEYANIPLTKTSQTTSTGEVVYEGSLQLAGFRQTSNVAAFFKGPKHLQVKYGVSGQTTAYNKAGGEVTLTSNKDTSPVLDFTKYPMLAGDIDGNGVIDGVDFAKVKAKASRFEQVADGGYIAEDLDGSCQVNNNDSILLVRSLNEKQDQVY